MAAKNDASLPNDRIVAALFAGALFLSAFLLFVLEPMVAKSTLPTHDIGRDMMRSIVQIGLVALGLSIGSTLRAQDSSAVAIGTRLRLRTVPGSTWHYGTFGGVAADSLVLNTALGAADHRYYGPSLDAIDVRDQNRDGRSAHIRNGAAAGAITGAVLLLVAVRHCTATSRSTDGPPCSIGYVGLPLWMLGGLVAGGGVGAAWPARHWTRVTWAALMPEGRARPNER